MAEREEIATVIGNLRGKIDVLKRTLGPDSDLARLISHAETDLDGLAARYAAASTGEDLTPIRTTLDDLDKVLSRILAVQTPPPDTQKSLLERGLAFLGQSGPSIGILVLAIIFILTIIAISQMGAAAWQTVPGGRAVLLLALTFAFVTFGGTLLVTPFFSASTEGRGFDERFRRSREIFLLFAGMFSTIVGFYFASANNPAAGSTLLVIETFNADKGDLQVAVTGGKPSYTIEVEYGEKGVLKKKAPASLETPGTVQFTFAKESDWPRPITVKVKDSADATAERRIVPEKDELIAAGFKEPQPEQNRGAALSAPQLTLSPTFDESAGTVEVAVTGGKPPYKVEVIASETNSAALSKRPVAGVASKSVDRPCIDKEIEDLVVRMAREHRSWGDDRIRLASSAACKTRYRSILKRSRSQVLPPLCETSLSAINPERAILRTSASTHV